MESRNTRLHKVWHSFAVTEPENQPAAYNETLKVGDEDVAQQWAKEKANEAKGKNGQVFLLQRRKRRDHPMDSLL